MARESYLDETGKEKNIHEMTTRELRGYIYDKAREAQARLNTADMSEASKAFKDAANAITNRSGKVMQSTSNMTKAEMRERAYDLRQFASLDTTSGFAKSIEWKENRSKYESFIRTQLEDPLFRDEFMKNLTKKGLEQYSEYKKGNIPISGITGISKKGFQEYRGYIQFLSNISTIIEQYGYETIKQYAVESKSDPKRARVIERLLFKIYNDSFDDKGKSKGWTQSEMAKRFSKALEAYDKQQTENARILKSVSSMKAKTQKKSTAGSVKIKQGRKMRTHGTVRGKLT